MWKLLPWVPSSGTGSSESYTREYRSLIEEFIKSHGINSVVDFGCGDWSFSQFIDWSNVRYTGIDVVPNVIITNVSVYGKDNVEFKCIDIANIPIDEIPYADLWIVKDVFQHWPLEDITNFLRKITLANAYKYLIFTDCSTKDENIDIQVGHFRPLNHQRYPFQEYSPTDIYSYNGKIVSVITDEPINFDRKEPNPCYPDIVTVIMSWWK